ncbi:MAG: ATP-binding cassette domain-containing protein [Cellvibrionaceae bacterium]
MEAQKETTLQDSLQISSQTSSQASIETNPEKITDSKKPNSKANIKILSSILQFIKPYKWQTVGAGVALIFTALVNLVMVQGLRIIIDEGFVAQSSEALTKGILFLFVLVVLMSLGAFCRFYLVTWLGERVSGDIRKAVFNHVINLHPHYFETNRSGEIMSRLTTDTALLQNIIGSSASMALRNFLMLIGGVVMLFATNFKLSLAVIVCVPLVLVPIFLLGKKIRVLSRKSQDAIAEIGTHAGEVIQNIKTVQSYTREDMERETFKNAVEYSVGIAKKRIRLSASLIMVVSILVFSAIGVMLWLGGNDVLSGKMTGGELGAFIVYAIMVAGAVATISEVFSELQRAAGATERLMELLQEESLITAPNEAQLKTFNDSKTTTNNHDTNTTESSTNNAIVFNHIRFCYPSRPNTPALDDINFILKSGGSLALVGPSGAGKSTVFELLQRFYDPDQGDILFENNNLLSLTPHDFRQQIAVVSQQPSLFTADVNYNIRYGNPEATDEEVIAAAKAAHAHEFISQLPEGYSSNLGEQGVRLSGGQRQRLAIARAILKNPKILLLDEATSALDSESERHVQLAINELMQDRTTIIIAHRLSTIKHVDRIAVMDAGKITAIGSHEELIKTSELYQKLYNLQFKESKNQSA